MRKHRITGLFVALSVVVIALGYWGVRKFKPTNSKEELSGKELFLINTESLTALQLNKKDFGLGDYTEIKLEKKDGQWKIVAPFSADADHTVVNALIESMLTYKFKRTLDEAEGDPSQYGLADPLLALSVKGNDGQSVALLVGKDSPDGKRRYAGKKDEEAIYLVDRSIEDALSKTIVDLRDKSLHFPKLDQIESIEILPIEGKLFKIERDGNAWKLTGKNGEVKEDKLLAYFQALSSIPPKDILDKPSSQVRETLTFGDSATIALHLKDSDEVWRLTLVIYGHKYVVIVSSFPGRIYRYDDRLNKVLRWNAENFLSTP